MSLSEMVLVRPFLVLFHSARFSSGCSPYENDAIAQHTRSQGKRLSKNETGRQKEKKITPVALLL